MATNTLALDLPLPIIISDWDAVDECKLSNSNTPSASSQPQQDGTICSNASTTSPIERNWNTGFSDFADDLWKSMTTGMKKKLREACVEVLHQTDEKDGKLSWEYDDDARFLD